MPAHRPSPLPRRENEDPDRVGNEDPEALGRSDSVETPIESEIKVRVLLPPPLAALGVWGLRPQRIGHCESRCNRDEAISGVGSDPCLAGKLAGFVGSVPIQCGISDRSRESSDPDSVGIEFVEPQDSRHRSKGTLLQLLHICF